MLPAVRGSLQPRQAPSRRSKTTGEILKLRVGENGPLKTTKPIRAVKAADPGKPVAKTFKGSQLNGHSTRLSAPSSRRNSRCSSTTAAPSKAEGGLTDPPPSQVPTKKPQLSTSIVSSGSPSVKQSTPIELAEQENRALLTTPKSLLTSPTVLQQPAFSLSSIEGSMATPSARQLVAPQTDETYTVTQAGPGEVAGQRTPKTGSKKRRSFIPTPGGQVCSDLLTETYRQLIPPSVPLSLSHFSRIVYEVDCTARCPAIWTHPPTAPTLRLSTKGWGSLRRPRVPLRG